MKYTSCTLLLLLLLTTTIFAQQYVCNTQKSTVEVSSSGRFRISNNIKEATIDFGKGTIFCQVTIKDFNFGPKYIFQATTTISRFLKSYVDCVKFPYVIYRAKITNLNDIHFEENGIHQVQTEGVITAHGQHYKTSIPLTLEKYNDQLTVYADFFLYPIDHFGIVAKNEAQQNVFRKVRVKIHSVLSKE